LAPQHREYQRGERDESEDDLAEPCVHPNQRVVGECEGTAESEYAIQHCPGQRPASWNWQAQHRHDEQQQCRGERKSQAGSPQRR
jgi:hypothetical protein